MTATLILAAALVSQGFSGDINAAVADHRAIQAVDPKTAYCTVYLTLAAVPADKLEDFCAGASFWFNSLSTSGAVQPLRRVTPTLLSGDLRNYNIDPRAWQNLTREDGYFYVDGSIILRGDYFCDQTSNATLSQAYYQFIYGPGKEPKNLKQLQAFWEVDLNKVRKFGQERGWAIKKGESGVAWQNRLFTRAPAITGSFWQTYDSKTSAGKQNLPNNLGGTFQEDAGEDIGNLPNGLQWYFLHAGKDRAKVDFADPSVVKVHYLYTAKRCVDCHTSTGILVPNEFIPEWVQQGVDLDSYDPYTDPWFKAFYASDPDGRIIKQAQETYREAVVQCWDFPGFAGKLTDDQKAQKAARIVQGFLGLVDWYTADVTLEQAARETGYTPEQIKATLSSYKTTNINLVGLGAGDVVPRDEWAANSYRELKSLLRGYAK